MVAGSVTSAAVPGAAAWDVVVGDRFIVAVAAPAPDPCMSALADAAGDPAVSVESLVGLVPTGGDGAVESFAVVYWPHADPSEVTAVVRGDAVVDLTSPGGTRRFDARGIRPWHLADFEAVVALRLTAADAPLDRLGEAPDVVGHARATLRASAVEWSAAHARRRATEAAAADADTVFMLRRRAPVDDAETFEASVADTARGEGDREDEAEGDRQPHPEHAAADTILVARRPRVAVPPSSPSVDADLAGNRAHERAGAPTVPIPNPVLPPPVSAPAPSAASVRPSAPTPPNPEPRLDTPGFRVGDGPTRRLTAPVLIGRRPLPPRVPGVSGAPPELLVVPSPKAVVSATHLELRLEGSRLVATDLRSTNGTVVRTPAGSRRMRAGESIVVMPGTSLDLGDGTIIEIVSAPAAPPE
jgi:hypothetical protein